MELLKGLSDVAWRYLLHTCILGCLASDSSESYWRCATGLMKSRCPNLFEPLVLELPLTQAKLFPWSNNA